MESTKIIWPIIQNFKCYEDYPFEAIDASALTLLQEPTQRSLTLRERNNLVSFLRSLECCLQVTRQYLTASKISHETFHDTCRLFIGALNSDVFCNQSIQVKNVKTREFISLLTALRTKNHSLRIPIVKSHVKSISLDIQSCVQLFEKSLFDEEKVWLWHGWASVSRNGRTMMLPLYPVYKRLGRDFTDRLHSACDVYLSSRRTEKAPGLKSLTRFIGQHSSDLTARDLQRPEFTTKFWRDFFVYYVRTCMADGGKQQISTCLSNWRSGVLYFINECLIPSKLFAKPWGELPSPPSRHVSGARTHIRTTTEGQEVKTKLLTHIPLHVSDDQAMHLLFEQIQRDHDCLVEWAKRETSNIWECYQRRISLSASGQVRIVQKSGTNSGNHQWITDRSNSDHMKNAATTFSHHGYLTNEDALLKAIYPLPLLQTATEFGLPTVDALLPHCTLLVAAHPAITPSFLERLELFDKDGSQTGFVYTNGGLHLVGYKHRRGPARSQQIIHLTDNTAEVVRQIIALTQPLRDYLKAHNDPCWRYLLLSCGKGFGYPIPVRRLAASTSIPEKIRRLSVSLGATSQLSLEQRHELATRFSLVTFRASAGVLVYLKTRSVAKMAEALGHAEYNPRLMRHYLPDSVLGFFQDRWIRIFQSGLIVEALKNSEFLLEAAGFSTIDELHIFLSHHALRIIPKHIEYPEDHPNTTESRQEKYEVVFGVNAGILTALYSLQLAVEHATEPVCAKAKYWAGISKHLLIHIETNLLHREDIQSYLKVARIQANPLTMKALIHA